LALKSGRYLRAGAVRGAAGRLDQQQQLNWLAQAARCDGRRAGTALASFADP
jgi:hypothetical protein